jgi:hypothetical protein
MRGCLLESQNPTHWKLTGSNLTATSPALSLNGVLAQPLSHYAFIRAKKKFTAHFKHAISNFYICTVHF